MQDDISSDESAEVTENLDAVQDTDAAEKAEDDRVQSILSTAQERLKQAQEAETEIRKLARDDMRFRAGDQWPDRVKQDRDMDGRPCLVINRLPQFVQQITNDQRQNRPCIKVHPVSDGADEETAEVIQGIIKHIEVNSNADVAYDTAFESSANCGFGFWRVLTDFASPQSFDQEIFIKRIRDAMSVYLDPFAQEPDASDAAWGFIIDDLSSDEFKQKYPQSKVSKSNDWTTLDLYNPEWMKDDSVQIAEYFYKEFKDSSIHMLSTGETVPAEQLQDRIMKAAAAGIHATVTKSRAVKIPVVRWLKINAVEILEETIWPGSFIPIIPVYGAELIVDGKRILEGVIRNAKDPQRMLNYWKSAETEAIALAPRAPFLAVEGQLEGYEKDWETANKKNHAYLYYKPVSINGQPAPPPQRQAVEPAVQAITMASASAAEDLKATTGIYAPNVEQDMAGASGIAIQRRNTQVQTSNFHLVDNLSRAQRHTGRILVEIIPQIYDSARAQRIIGDDGTQKIVKINQTFKDESGKEVIYSLDEGLYGVTIDSGPSFASKRQEAAASMMDFSRSMPQTAQYLADLIAKNMDWPDAEEMADRLRKLLPPALQDDPNMKDIPPQFMAQMQQAQQMIQQLSQHLNEKTQIIEKKQIEVGIKEMELKHDERIELMKNQTQLEIANATLNAKQGIALLQQEIGALNHRMKVLGMDIPIGSDDPLLNPDFAQQPAGGNPAMAGPGPQPTGGQSPGPTPGANP